MSEDITNFRGIPRPKVVGFSNPYTPTPGTQTTIRRVRDVARSYGMDIPFQKMSVPASFASQRPVQQTTTHVAPLAPTVISQRPTGSAVGPFDMSYRGSRGVASSRLAGWNARLNSTAMGRAFKMGTMESFGWHFEGGVSQGFLGLREQFAGSQVGRAASSAGMRGQNRFAAGFKAASRQARGLGVLGTGKAVAGFGGRTAAKSLGLLSTAYFAYEGYQEEGVWGAAKGVGESIAYSTAFNYVLGGIGASALAYIAPVAGIAALAGATYMLGEAGIAHAKGLRELEMGGGDLMQQAVTSAGAATARQRSLIALNNTHINGRMAIGNEAFLMHRGFSA